MSVEFAMCYVLCFTCYILRVDAMFVEMATFIFEACVQEDIQVIFIRRGFKINVRSCWLTIPKLG